MRCHDLVLVALFVRVVAAAHVNQHASSHRRGHLREALPSSFDGVRAARARDGLRARSRHRQKVIGPPLTGMLDTTLARSVRTLGHSILSLVREPTQDELLCKMQDMVKVKIRRDVGEVGRLDTNYSNCSVISSSGVLTLHSHGEAIDLSDLTIRFNDAPVEGFEEYVGSRIDVRGINDESPKKMLEGFDEEELNSSTFEEYPINGARESPPVTPDFPSDVDVFEGYVMKAPVLLDFADYLDTVYADEWFASGDEVIPTSGAAGMLTALDLCNEVRAYGMAVTPNTKTAPYHYYEPDAPGNNADFHATFDAEKDLWRRLADNSGSDIDATDMAIIRGFSKADCSNYNGNIPVIPYPVAAWLQRVHLIIAGVLAGLAVVQGIAGLGWLFYRALGPTEPLDGWPAVVSRHPSNFGMFWRLLDKSSPAHKALAAYAISLIMYDMVLYYMDRRFGCDPVIVMLWAELLKISVSFFYLAKNGAPGREGISTTMVPRASASIWTEAIVRQTLVALMYAGNADLVQHKLANVHMSNFVEWRNLAVFVNIGLLTVQTGKNISTQKALGALLFLMGCLHSQFHADGIFVPAVFPEMLPVPLKILLASVFVSGCAAVMNECTMKTPYLRDTLGIDVLNLILYVLTAIFMAITLKATDRGLILDVGTDFGLVLCVIVQAAIGLAVSRVLFYTDSVTKAMAGGSREMAAYLIGPIFNIFRYDWITIFAATWTATGLLVYFAPEKPSQKSV